MKNSTNLFKCLVLVLSFNATLSATIYVLKSNQSWMPFGGIKSINSELQAIMVKNEKDKTFCILQYDAESKRYYNLGTPCSGGYEPAFGGYCYLCKNPIKAIPGMEILDSIECSDFYVPLEVYP